MSSHLKLLNLMLFAVMLIALCKCAPPAAPTNSCPSDTQDVTQGSNVAHPDDDADDAGAIQQQINALPNGSTTTLCFPPGTYDFASRVWVEGKVVNLQGLGAGTSILRRYPDSTNHSLFGYQADNGGSVDGFTIDGSSSSLSNTSTNRQMYMFVYWSTNNANVANNTFQNIMGDGVMYTYTSGDEAGACSNYGKVDSNTFINHNEGREAIFFVCGGNLTASDNKIYNWADPSEPGGIDVEVDYTQNYLHDILVTGNYIENWNTSKYMWHGVHSAMDWYAAPSTNVTFSYNEVTGYFRTGIQLEPTPPDTILADHNYVHDIQQPSGYTSSGFYNYSSDNPYTNNTVSNIANGTGLCIDKYVGAPQLSGNSFSGCV